MHVFADVSFSGMVCCKMVEECDFTSAILLRISSIAGCRVVGGGRSTCFLKFGPFFNWAMALPRALTTVFLCFKQKVNSFVSSLCKKNSNKQTVQHELLTYIVHFCRYTMQV